MTVALRTLVSDSLTSGGILDITNTSIDVTYPTSGGQEEKVL